jgi:isoquinoline 1-oxidoreductase beta subunit
MNANLNTAQKVAKAKSGPSRREAIVTATVAGGALAITACSPTQILALGTPNTDFGAFGPFVRIAPDGGVTVVAKHIEFGQGSSTGMAAIVAEEMDADWSRVSIALAPGNTKAYANTLMGVQGTGGSTAINESWEQMRKAGAAARALFVQAAAQQWSVSPDQITVKDGVVSGPGGKSATFAELLPAAAKQTPPQAPKLKDPKDFTLIGTARVARKDSHAKSTGAPLFTQDVYEPGMLTAVVLHAPRFGGKIKSFDATAAKKVPGVVDVFQIPTGVAVVATGVYAAKKGREALTGVQWDDAKAERRSSDKMFADYKAIADGAAKEGWVSFDTKGKVADGDFADGPDVLHATYAFPYLAHAPMEPMNCTARVGGGKTVLKFASQIPSLDQMNTALIVGALPGSVEIETLYAGGSFGRRATVDSDYVVECVHIAKHVGGGKPVKLVWTREDDMTGGKYRPMAYHDVKVKVGKDGYPVAWRHRVVVQSFMKGTMMASMGVKNGLDSATVEGAMGSPYLKAIPVTDCQVATPVSPVSTLWWRSVGATHTAMVMEHTVDQLAARAKIDPVSYRRALYTKAGADKHLKVLDMAVDKSGWATSLKDAKDGWARGIAVHESFGSVVANVVEVKLDGAEPKVRRAVAVIDCGVAIAPDQVAAQMEGGLNYGLSSALFGQVTLKDGLVQQQNFDTYRVLRMSEAPAVETYIVPSAAHPTGVGEPGTPVVIPAVANALLAAGHGPTSALPFVKA